MLTFVCSVCGARPARQFMNAKLCTEHAPVYPEPDPELTAEALRERHLRRVRAAADRAMGTP